MRLRRDSAANRKASSDNRKVFSEQSEGFFRRALGSYTHKFPKHGAASLTYLPRSRLDLPRSRLGLPRLRLSWNSGPATEGFSNRGINFKDAYRTSVLILPALPYDVIMSPINSLSPAGSETFPEHRQIMCENIAIWP